jgi:hypothetical protein
MMNLALIFCGSILVGAVWGVVARGHRIVAITGSLGLAVAICIVAEWRFGGTDEWSWNDPLTSLAYLIGPSVALVIAPTVGVALLVRLWCNRRKSSNQTIQRTPTRRSPEISHD